MTGLLPPNATDLERAVADATGRISDIPVDIDRLWSPDDCPPALLPWLAWALAVTVWDDDWPLDRKRRVCATALALHRTRGTLPAIKNAIAALDIQARVTRWFDQTPAGPPHTFDVTVPLNDNVGEAGADTVIGDRRLTQLAAAVDGAKNGTAHFSLGVTSDHETATGVAAALRAKVHVSGDGEAKVHATEHATVSVAVSIIPRQFVKLTGGM